MAEFTVREVEGMRQVRIDIHDETVRARRGAMSNMRGAITLTPRLPGAGDVLRSIFTSEARVRPYYSGTGSILLQPSLGGYHVLDVTEGEGWILEPGVYWASEGSVELGLSREPFWASLWAGDGLLVWKTTVSGHGRVAINAPGPVETVDVARGRAAGAGAAGARPNRRPRLHLAALGALPAQLHLRPAAAAGLWRQRAGAGLLDALLERAPLQADDRREHRGIALRVAAGPLTRAPRRPHLARRRGRESAVAGEAFIEVDHGPGGAPARFAAPAARVTARTPEAVPAALAALDAALGRGAWVAGLRRATSSATPSSRGWRR